ncbi:prepilin-type N-terminal cleavage/methylation domain-containing protein [Halomonas organivorans]
MRQCRQRGFGLVELLVAMAIGLIVTLGAGAVFLDIHRNQAVTQALGEQQSLLTFAADSLIQDVRRASTITVEDDEYVLTFPDGNQHHYRIVADGGLQLKRSQGDTGYQTLVTQAVPEQQAGDLMTRGGDPASWGSWQIHLEMNDDVTGTVRAYDVTAVQRNAAIERDGGSE